MIKEDFRDVDHLQETIELEVMKSNHGSGKEEKKSKDEQNQKEDESSLQPERYTNESNPLNEKKNIQDELRFN